MNEAAYFAVPFENAKDVAGTLADNKHMFMHVFIGGHARFYFEGREAMDDALADLSDLHIHAEVNEE